MKENGKEYIVAVIMIIRDKFELKNGLDLYCYSNLPMGAGISSSASFILSSLLSIMKTLKIPIPLKMDLV